MTNQMLDTIIFDGTEHTIVGKDGDDLFEPQNYGLHPGSTCFACYRGFFTQYIILNSKLYLDKLTIGLGKDKTITVNDKLPSYIDPLFGNVYEDVCLPVSFTGKLKVGSNIIEQYFTDSFCPAAYKKVQEIIFSDGVLTHVKDISYEMKKIRDTGNIMNYYD